MGEDEGEPLMFLLLRDLSNTVARLRGGKQKHTEMKRKTARGEERQMQNR